MFQHRGGISQMSWYRSEHSDQLCALVPFVSQRDICISKRNVGARRVNDEMQEMLFARYALYNPSQCALRCTLTRDPLSVRTSRWLMCQLLTGAICPTTTHVFGERAGKGPRPLTPPSIH